MIVIESLQQKKDDEPEAGASRFSFRNVETLSKGPLLIAMAISAVAAYFRTALPAEAAEHQQQPGTPAPGNAVAPVDFERGTAARNGAANIKDDADEGEDQPEAPLDFFAAISAADNVIPFPVSTAVAVVDSGAFSYKPQAPVSAGVVAYNANTGAASTIAASNDNGGGHVFGPTEDSGAAPSLPTFPPVVPKPAEPDTDEEPDPDPGEEPGGGPAVEEPGSVRKNRAPTVSSTVRLNDVFAGQVVLIGLSELIGDAVDADGDELVVTGIRVSQGQLTPLEGSWIYGDTSPYRGEVTVSYAISDGQALVAQTAHFEILDLPVGVTPQLGSEGDDRLVGTNGADAIDGRGGDDVINGLAGNDIIIGGEGNDIIRAGAGDDVVRAGSGNDQVLGGDGNDDIEGGSGDDTLKGEAGDDVLKGEEGRDFIEGNDGDDVANGGADGDVISGGTGEDRLAGGAGDDTAYGDAGDDVVTGDAGMDSLFGGEGADIVKGGGGNDYMEGNDGADRLDAGAGVDIVAGGAGDDVIVGALDGEADRYEGGEGQDILDLSAAEVGVTVDFVIEIVTGMETGNDEIDGIEEVVGGSGNDRMVGGSGDETLVGNAGDDVLKGNAGADIIEGGAGADTLAGGAGNDRLLGGDGDDAIQAGAGDDAVAGGEGSDRIEGNAGSDIIDAGEGADIVIAGLGDDILIASVDSASDSLDGGGGLDTLDLSGTSLGVTVDLVAGTAASAEIGADTIASVEAVIGGAGDDSFAVGSQSMILTGGGGDDSFLFGRAQVSDAISGEMMHQIIDFMVGDLIKLDKLEITEVARDLAVDLFEDVYQNRATSSVSVQIRYERVNDMDHTMVDVDFDRDQVFELSLDIYGHHTPFIYDTANV